MTLYDRPRLQVLVSDRDLTERCDSLTFSATDQGGYEIATLGLPAADRPKKGQSITIRQGLEVAWAGRVAEIADHSQHGRATKTTGCEGLRALLRDTNVSMIYVDRDISRWGAQPLARQIGLGTTYNVSSGSPAPDPANASPALVQVVTDDWTTVLPMVENWYDAGPGNLINKIFYDRTYGGQVGTGQQWVDSVAHASDSAATITESPGNLYNTLSLAEVVGYTAPATPYRFAFIQHYYSQQNAGAAGNKYPAYWHNPAVYGNHGLTTRGSSDPQGFYPSDIARHALSQCSGVAVGNIQDASGYIASHVVYRTPTPVDTIIDDMAKLMGWTWGVWEPPTVLDSSPRLDFRPPPTDATCVISKAECDQLDITSRLGDLYNVCQVTYTDAAGTVGIATVTLANPQLAETGIGTKTLQLNMGAGSAAEATSFGQVALALSQVSARAAGQATLPVSVRLPGGGSKPACLIRPGIDRLRIVDLLDGGPLLDLGTARRDVFRISRTETTVGRDGAPSTRVELDSGTNLLETLQARLAISAGVVGSGASGG